MDKTAYKLKIKQNRSKLKKIGVKNAMYYFTIKFPEYKWAHREDKEWNKMDNLWYGKIVDEDFLTKLNAFVHFKKVEFE